MFCVIAVTILVYFSVSASRIRTVHIVFLHGIFCLHITGYITVSLHCECPWETAGVLQTALINLWWQVLQERASRSWILTVLFMTKLNHHSDLWCPIVPLGVFRVLNSLVIIPSAPWSSHLTSADLLLPLDLCQQSGQTCKCRWKRLMSGALICLYFYAHPGKTEAKTFFAQIWLFYGSGVLYIIFSAV